MALRPEERNALAELVRRYRVNAAPLQGLFDNQLSFINDSSRFVSAYCSRRAGKTFALVRKMVDTGLATPAARVGYMCDTYGHAESLVWTPLLDYLTDEGIAFEANSTKLRVHFKHNRSVLQIGGCEDERKARKLLGHAFHLLIIDEAQSFPPFLKRLIQEIVGPAMGDYGGQIIVSGTPEPTCTSYFHNITVGYDSRFWSVHHWTVRDNPMFPQWAGQPDWQRLADEWLAEQRQLFGYSEDDSRYLRDYKGLWARSTEKMILVVPDSQIIHPAMIPPHKELTKVLGVDLGYEDEAAWVVVGFPPHEKKLYEVDSFSENHLTLTDTVDTTRRFIEKYSPDIVVIDPARAGNALVGEVNKRFGVGAKVAIKKEKADGFTLLRNDLRSSRVFFRDDRKTALQARALSWNTQRTREAEGIPCDLMDAFLYAYREALHWAAVEKETPPTLGSKKQIDEEEKRKEEREMHQAVQAMREREVDFY